MPNFTPLISSACLLIATLLPISPDLSGYENTDTLAYSQDEAVPARLLTFRFFPGHRDESVGDFALSLEGLHLTGRGDSEGFTLSDKRNLYWMSHSADGWYAVEVVKRYHTQDMEVWVEGIPVFLSEALETLDPWLEQDEVILISDGYPALLDLGEIANLYWPPASVLEMDYIAPSRSKPVAGASPAPFSPDAPYGDNGAKSPIDSIVAASAPLSEAANTPPETEAACSGLFTPLF